MPCMQGLSTLNQPHLACFLLHIVQQAVPPATAPEGRVHAEGSHLSHCGAVLRGTQGQQQRTAQHLGLTLNDREVLQLQT